MVDPNDARTKRRSYRREARKFLIWREAESRSWDCTIRDIAEAICLDPRVAGRIAAEAGWTHRFRSHLIDSTGAALDIHDHVRG